MIITITFNPSIDYIYDLPIFLTEGKHHRVDNPLRTVGGKGINTARALHALGEEVLGLTVIGGLNGEVLKNRLQSEGIPMHFFKIKEETRTSMTFMSNSNQTEVVERGPYVTEDTIGEVENYLQQLFLTEPHISCISINGTIINDDLLIYQKLLHRLSIWLPTDTKILMDLSQPLLKPTITGTVKPYFIKPNLKELSDLLQKNITTKSDVISALKENVFLHDIPFILVSMGAEGAIAKMQNSIYQIDIPKIKVINPTGSGDSTVAGVCFGISHQLSDEELLKYAMACGISNTMHQQVGGVKKSDISTLLAKITVKKI